MSSAPLEIRKTGPVEITVRWTSDHVSVFGTRRLRLECTCAACVNEVTGVRVLDPGSVLEEITVTAAEHVGRYGIKFTFSDGHDDGIYTWSKLRSLCECSKCASGANNP